MEVWHPDAVVDFAFDETVEAFGCPAELGEGDEVALLLDVGRGEFGKEAVEEFVVAADVFEVVDLDGGDEARAAVLAFWRTVARSS